MPKYCYAGLIVPLLIGAIGCKNAPDFGLEQVSQSVWVADLADSISLAQHGQGEFSLAENRLFQLFQGTGLVVEYGQDGKVVQAVDAWQGGLSAGHICGIAPNEEGLAVVEVQESQLLRYPQNAQPYATPIGNREQVHAYWYSHGAVREGDGFWIHLLKVGTHPFTKDFYTQNSAFRYMNAQGEILKEIGHYPDEYQQDSVLAGNSGCTMAKLPNGQICVGFEGSGEVQYWTTNGVQTGSMRFPWPDEYQITPISDAFAEADRARAHSWLWGPLVLDPKGRKLFRLLQGPTSSKDGSRSPSFLYTWDWATRVYDIKKIIGNTIMLGGFTPEGQLLLLQKDNARLVLSAFSG